MNILFQNILFVKLVFTFLVYKNVYTPIRAMDGAGALFKNFQKMAHNVPAVYDVFASPIKETVGFQGWQNVPE
jgi:hypothetical protein